MKEIGPQEAGEWLKLADGESEAQAVAQAVAQDLCQVQYFHYSQEG